jgi:MinD superfamily P-loop ATPase
MAIAGYGRLAAPVAAFLQCTKMEKSSAFAELLLNTSAWLSKEKKVTTKCGNKRCVCPDHVLPATPVALGKMVSKRTGYASFTVRNKKISDAKRANNSKLTAEQAKEIRESDDRLIDIAKKYGIAAATAQRIKAGKVWKTYGATPFSGLGAR